MAVLEQQTAVWVPSINPDLVGLYLRRVFSGEVCFALFLMSWAYGDEWSHLGPVSIRAVFLCCSGLWFLRGLISGAIRYSSTAAYILLALFVFIAYAFFSLFWSPPDGIGLSRFGDMIVLGIPALLFGTAVVQTRQSLLRFQIGLIIGLVIGAFHIYLEARAPSSQFIATILDTNGYQGLNRMLGMGGLALCMALAYQIRKFWQIALSLGVLTAAMGEMMVLGGLTGLIAFVGCIGLFCFSLVDFDRIHLLRLTPRTIFLTSLLLLGCIVVVVLLNLSIADVVGMPRAVGRIVAKLQWGGMANSASIVAKDGRLDLWTKAIQVWAIHPLFGSGLGSWSMQAGSENLVGDYAHNIILEILGELGIFGLLMFIAPLVVLIKNLVSAWHRIDPLPRDLSVLFSIFCLLHALIMGNIGGDYWTFAGIATLFVGVLYRSDRYTALEPTAPSAS